MPTAGRSDDISGTPPPEECGWIRVTGPVIDLTTGVAVYPRSGRCSVAMCPAAVRAAIKRAASGTRGAYWQLYCAEHAHQRGVDIHGEQLDWADGFRLR
jgi:hypothetical protein